MSRVKDFFNKVLNKVTGKDRPGKDLTGTIAEPMPGFAHGGKMFRRQAPKSQRERKFGRANAAGTWMSPWDLQLLHWRMVTGKPMTDSDMGGHDVFMRLYGPKTARKMA